MPRRAFTAGMVRVLRRLKLARPRRRMPRQQQPDTIRLEYYKALLPHVRVAWHEFARVRDEILRALERERARDVKADADWRELVRGLIDRARKASINDISKRALEDTARRYAKRTSEFQREQLNRQTEAGMGVPLSAIEAPIVERVEVFVRENVDLIVSVHERFFDRIERDVEEAFESGMRPETLAERLQERDGMSERDAMRIARDQIGKLNGQVNEERQKGMGVTSYIWRTVNDNRVRDEHAEREGKRYEWSDPPEDGHPGEAIQCRCFAEPVFDDILAALE